MSKKFFCIFLVIFFFLFMKDLNTASVLSKESFDILISQKNKIPPLNKRYLLIQSYFDKYDGCLSYEFLKYIDECLSYYDINSHINLEMFVSLMFIESSFIQTSVSSAGAYGLTQIMKNTADIINKAYSDKLGGVSLDRKDPYDNVMLSIIYLRDLLVRYSNDIESALRFYNGGTHWKQKKSTKKYYFSIIKLYGSLSKYVLINNI